MDGQDNRLLLERYLAGLLDPLQEYALRREDVVIDMPQSGERIRGRDHMKAMQEAYPGPPTITVRHIVGSGDVWVVEGRSDYSGRIYHVATIFEFREGKFSGNRATMPILSRPQLGGHNGLSRLKRRAVPVKWLQKKELPQYKMRITGIACS
jgi:hypothetical protein